VKGKKSRHRNFNLQESGIEDAGVIPNTNLREV